MITTSSRVRAKDFRQPWFSDRVAELREEVRLHRKVWEFATIAQVFKEHCGPESLALGFGVGQESLPAYFARCGAFVTATDAPEGKARDAWTKTGQYSNSVENLRRPDICENEVFNRNVIFTAEDMNNISRELLTWHFDFTWSAGSLEHLGSLEKGITFFCRQMQCLRPGGIAVHTTELSTFGGSFESQDLSLYDHTHLSLLAIQLAGQGDTLFPLDLDGGFEPEDLHIDEEPWGLPHLQIRVGGHVTTSVVLVAQRGER